MRIDTTCHEIIFVSIRNFSLEIIFEKEANESCYIKNGVNSKFKAIRCLFRPMQIKLSSQLHTADEIEQ